MRFKIILNTTGIALKYMSIIFLFPIVFALFYKEFTSIHPFFVTGIIAFLIGTLFCLNDADEKDIDSMNRTEALATVLLSWGSYAIICAIPFLFFNLSPINALFESVSGISTTGATILSDFSLYSRTFFMYRALMQWFGGMGIMVLFIAVLPKFAVAGRQIFFAEASNPTEEKITPRIRHTASWLWSIYILLTVIQIVCYSALGLSFYDSICLSFSTISAGGFSNYANGLIGQNSALIWVGGFFAFLAGMNFILTYKVLIKGKINELFKSEEFKTYFGIVFVITLLIAAVLYFEGNMPFNVALRDAFYETASTITSTGSTSSDYILWPQRAQIFLFILMFIGGSAISASGGIKVARWVYLFKYIKNELNKIVHPNMISPVKLDGRTVPPETGHQIIIFFMFFIAIFAISTVLVALIEQNTILALTGSIATLSNTGPGFEASIGPVGNYNDLNFFTKLIFTFNMFVGRLEIIPFLAILNKDLWQIKR